MKDLFHALSVVVNIRERAWKKKKKKNMRRGINLTTAISRTSSSLCCSNGVCEGEDDDDAAAAVGYAMLYMYRVIRGNGSKFAQKFVSNVVLTLCLVADVVTSTCWLRKFSRYREMDEVSCMISQKRASFLCRYYDIYVWMDGGSRVFQLIFPSRLDT